MLNNITPQMIEAGQRKRREEALLQAKREEQDMKDIMALAEDGYPRIPESDFINYLLPELKKYNDDPSTCDLSVWIQMAGQYDQRIGVTHDNTDEILFIIPPIIRSVKTVIAGTDRAVSISQAISEAGVLQARSQLQADVLVSEHVQPRIIPTEMPKEWVDAWNYICTRYSLVETPDDDKSNTSAERDVFENGYDDEEYEYD